MGRTVLVAAVAGWLVAGVPASAQTITLPQPDVAVSGLVGTVTGAVAQVVDEADAAAGAADSAVTGGTAGDRSGSAAGTSSSSPSSSSSSTSSSGGSAARGSTGAARGESARGRGYRSSFDRLPRRLERLLERIELGRNVEANLRRLERLLAAAGPARRAMVRRALRAEIRRLRAGGLTPAERRRVRRLERAERSLFGGSAPTASSPAGTSLPQPVPSAGRSAPAEDVSGATRRKGGGVLEAQAGGATGPAGGPPTLPTPRLPDSPEEFPFGVGLALLALVALGFFGIVAGVTSHVLGRMRSG